MHYLIRNFVKNLIGQFFHLFQFRVISLKEVVFNKGENFFLNNLSFFVYDLLAFIVKGFSQTFGKQNLLYFSFKFRGTLKKCWRGLRSTSIFILFFVPEMIRFKSPSTASLLIGFKISSPLPLPTLTAPIGPFQGMSERADRK